MTVSEITRATSGLLVIGDPKAAVSGISTDSRSVKNGDIFFAIKGEKFDGHAYLEDCIKRGASLCVVSQLPDRFAVSPSRFSAILKVKDTKRSLGDLARAYREKYGARTKRAGIVGSCGKTTVKDMLASIVHETAPSVSSLGNFNNDIGCPLSVLRLDPAHIYGVFEIGASARGEVQKLSEIVSPHVAIITNIRLEHTETFGSLEDIARGESEILSAILPGGTAVLPFEDEFFSFMKGRIPLDKSIETVSFGLTEAANVHAADIVMWPGPVKFNMVRKDDHGKILAKIPCELPVMGKFNILNACAAGAGAFALGIPKEKIQAGLAKFKPSPMRFEILQLKDDVTIVNDTYNSNPGSVRSSVEAFVESFSNKRLCIVLGDMLELGEISTREHEEIGKFLAGFAVSNIFFYGPQSRFSYQSAKNAFVDKNAIKHCTDPADLLLSVEECIQPGTAVLFKASRGMHLEEIVKKISEHLV